LKFNSVIRRIKKYSRKLTGKKPRQIPQEKKVKRSGKNQPALELGYFLHDLLALNYKSNFILDVGAHSTEWIRQFMKFYPEANVAMIEPLEEMEPHLKQFCVEFPHSKYFLKGAGATNETLILTVRGTLAGANFLFPENKFLLANNQQRKIEIITIDSLLENGEIEYPDFVKLDIQGFELEALKGASKLFGKTEVFVLEASLFEFMKGTPVLSDVIIFMKERGYEVYDFAGFLRRPYDGALGQVDVCFAKRDGFLRGSNAWAEPS